MRVDAGDAKHAAAGSRRGGFSFGRRASNSRRASFPSDSKLNTDLRLNDRFLNLVEEGIDVSIRIGDLADSNLITRGLAPTRISAFASPAYLDVERGLLLPVLNEFSVDRATITAIWPERRLGSPTVKAFISYRGGVFFARTVGRHDCGQRVATGEQHPLTQTASPHCKDGVSRPLPGDGPVFVRERPRRTVLIEQRELHSPTSTLLDSARA